MFLGFKAGLQGLRRQWRWDDALPVLMVLWQRSTCWVKDCAHPATLPWDLVLEARAPMTGVRRAAWPCVFLVASLSIWRMLLTMVCGLKIG